jgi:hypothetical protein
MIFYVIVFFAAIAFLSACVALYRSYKKISLGLLVLSVLLVFSALGTPKGNLVLVKLTASTKSGNWIVVDNSGGETMRHWILENSYVESSDRSDGWEFYDSKGNGPIYVSGDSFVMKINEPLEVFKEDYKQKYNIPKSQFALK